ncbi:MAG: N-acyl homoserine lactonase family protein [Solirubrobacteraceae bacterium]
MISVHALDTGRVKIHTRQVDAHPRDALRLLATLVDRKWTGWLPIWSFAIEHPEGLVVVDAGQDPGHVRPVWDVYESMAVRFEVTGDDALAVRLTNAGLPPADVRHHVFTHLHVDHVGAGPLPGARPTVSKNEWRAATRPGGRLRGYRYPGFPPDPVLVGDDHDLYGDGKIRILATPGHTHGHQSVLVAPTDGSQVLICGDAVYSETALLDKATDGVCVSPRDARASIGRLQDICRSAPTVVVPTHDPRSRDRLLAGRPTSPA